MHATIPSPSSRVLLAEDDPYMRRLIALHLQRDGHDVVEARDGTEALELLGTAVSRNDPLAAIVMDVRMPGRGGLAILRGLPEGARTIPVVLITAFGDEETHRMALELGAKAVLDKPFAMEVLRQLVADTISPDQVEDLARLRAWSNDRLLVERYLDLVNRAVAERRGRRRAEPPSPLVDGPIDLRVIEPGPGGTNVFHLLRQPLGGLTRASKLQEDAVVSCEVTREHLESAIAAPWEYLAHPERLRLWW